MFSKNTNRSLIIIVLAALLVAMLGFEAYSIVHLSSRIDRLESGPKSVSQISPLRVLADWARTLEPSRLASVAKEGATAPTATPALPGDWTVSQAVPAQWDPFQEMEQLQRQMDQLFGRPDLWGVPNLPVHHQLVPASLADARVVLHEQPDRFVVDVELPGASESDIQYTIDGQQLTINANRSVTSEKRDDQGNIVESAQRAGDFREILTLPGAVETSQVTSHFDNGVLEISIPRQSGDTEA